jgi:hypothetical protein
MRYPSTAQVRLSADTEAKPCGDASAIKTTWKPKDDFYETGASCSCLISLCHSYLNKRCYVQVLTLQELQIPPSFNMYLVIDKRITAVIL